MIAYFTEAAVVAAQLAGTTHQALSKSQRDANNANQPGASGCFPVWSISSAGCVSKVFCRFLALLPPMLLHWPENRQRAKQYSQCRAENNSLATLLPSNYAKSDSLVPSFKMEREPATDAHHHSFNLAHRTATPTWHVNKTISCHQL